MPHAREHHRPGPGPPGGHWGEPAVTGIVAPLRDEDSDKIVNNRVRPATERTPGPGPALTARPASADVPALQEPPSRRPGR